MKATKTRYILVMTFIVIPLMPIVSILDCIWHIIKHIPGYWARVWYDIKCEHKDMWKYLKQYFCVLFKKETDIKFDK